MKVRSAKEIGNELNHLLAEQIKSMKRDPGTPLTNAEVLRQEKQLKRIRELSSDYLAALKREAP